MIGEHLMLITLDKGNDAILQRIRNSCRNISSLKLKQFNGPPQLQDLMNLTPLSIKKCSQISINELIKPLEAIVTLKV